MIINIDPYQNTFYSRKINNNLYRHEGRQNTIEFVIDSKTPKTQEEILDFLESKSIDYLLNREGTIIDI